MKVFVVIPAFNEERSIGALVEQVASYVPAEQIVVVDDGSRRKLERPTIAPARLLRHPINLGKGMAMRTGCEFALSRGAEAIVLMDGDGQHDPAEIPRLVAALSEVELSFAARRLGKAMPPVRLVGNWVLNRSARLLFGLELSDVWCGYRAFRAEVYDKIAWTAHDYAVEVEMAIRAAKHRLRHRELPIGTIYHDAYKGVTVVDGLQLLLRLVAWKFTL